MKTTKMQSIRISQRAYKKMNAHKRRMSRPGSPVSITTVIELGLDSIKFG